jgi:hypothetical protein
MKPSWKYTPECEQAFRFGKKSKANKSKPKTKRRRYWSNPLAKINVPEVKPLPLVVGATAFTLVAAVGLAIGATIATYVFFGIASLLGFIAIAESNKWLRWAIVKSRMWVDLLIFALTMYFTFTVGVTLAAAWTIMGLGITCVYNPYVRDRERKLLNNI